MKLHIVVIRDIKANVFAQPQFVANIGGFIRSFADECQEIPKKVPRKTSRGFRGLRARAGRYGDGDAYFELLETPKQIAVGSNYTR